MQPPKHTRQSGQRELFARQHVTWEMLPDELHLPVIELLSVLFEQSLSHNELASHQHNPSTLLETSDEREDK